MIHFTPEGQVLKNGINFYPLSDSGSKGFRVRWTVRGVKHTFSVRWSTYRKRFFVTKTIWTPEDEAQSLATMAAWTA